MWLEHRNQEAKQSKIKGSGVEMGVAVVVGGHFKKTGKQVWGVEAGRAVKKAIIMAHERDYNGLTRVESVKVVNCMDSQQNQEVELTELGNGVNVWRMTSSSGLGGWSAIH